MKNIRKMGLIGIAAVLGLSAAGYGGWLAWDQGLIGNNPRAPTVTAMEAAVRKQSLINAVTRDAVEPCIAIDLNRPPPEVAGLPGTTQFVAPGRYGVTMLKETNVRDQPARDIQLGQMDYLASQGLLTATDGMLETDDGARPAKTYQLTWPGYAAIQQNHGGSLCLRYGRREFSGIETIEKLLEKVMDLDVYEVTYLTRTIDTPAWATTTEAVRLFPKLAQLTAETRSKDKIIRSGEGWRSANEVEMEAAQASKGAQAGNYLKEMMKNLERTTPSLDEAKTLVAAQIADPNWASRNSMACLPLQLQRGGDDKPAPGSATPTEFTVTYFDRGDRKEYEQRNMAKALYILSALEDAGLAQMELVKPPPPAMPVGKASRATVPLPPATQLAGIRYRVSREAVEALGLTNYGSGCVPVGRLKVEVLAVQGNRGVIQIGARGTVEQTPDWAAKIARKLPAMQSVIETGLPLIGQLNLAPEDGAGKWRLGNLSPSYPDINYATIPPHLAPLLPLTMAAFPAKTVKAPALVAQASPPPAGGAILPGAAPAPPPPGTPPSSPLFLPPPAPSVQREPPYPAGKAPVHVISIYQAPLPGGAQRGFQQHPEGVVKLSVSDPDAILLLFSYEPVEWHITVLGGISLKRVIATGYHDQRVTFAGGGKPQVVVTRPTELLRQAGLNLQNGFPTKHDPNDLVDIASISRALTGSLPQSFQGTYEAPAAGLTIGPNTSRFALPARQQPDSASTPVILRSAFGEAVQGNRLARGSAGAYTDAWSNHAYSAGKIYFEGKMRVTGALAGHTHANIGLCLARGNTIESSTEKTTAIRHGEQKLYTDGDTFGIAADLDQQRMYFHVNGTWVTGQPGSNNAFPLGQNKEYRACFFAAGTTSGEVKEGKPRSDTTWEVNFGDQPFAKAIPAGYMPFQGKK